jgi:hypothetical protein
MLSVVTLRVMLSVIIPSLVVMSNIVLNDAMSNVYR